MVKAGRKSRAPGRSGAAPTRDRIVDAAIETLKSHGFAGASAREIARTGGFNQALIFYHFGSISDLLLAALGETSSRRMESYRAEVEQARTLPELVEAAARIYREDLESGHIKVLAELIAASSSFPEMGPRISELVEPWETFARETIERALAGSPLAALLPPDELAHAVVALYLGMELLTHLDRDRSGVQALFQRASTLAPVLSALLPGAPERGDPR